jgi:hypothetical protein
VSTWRTRDRVHARAIPCRSERSMPCVHHVAPPGTTDGYPPMRNPEFIVREVVKIPRHTAPDSVSPESNQKWPLASSPALKITSSHAPACDQAIPSLHTHSRMSGNLGPMTGAAVDQRIGSLQHHRKPSGVHCIVGLPVSERGLVSRAAVRWPSRQPVCPEQRVFLRQLHFIWIGRRHRSGDCVLCAQRFPVYGNHV